MTVLHQPTSSSEVRTHELNLTMLSLKEVNRTMFTKYEKSKILNLNLAMNQISHIEDNTFNFFRNLKKLEFSSNSIQKLNKTSFDGLHKIEELDLAENFIVEIEIGTFDHMNYLRSINLNSNCIHTLPNLIFFRNYMLKNIYIMENQLENLPSEMLPYNQYLENLNISANEFPNMDSILKFIKIKSVDISNNKNIILPMPKNFTTNFITQLGKRNQIDGNKMTESSESSESDSDEAIYLRANHNSKSSDNQLEWKSSLFGNPFNNNKNSYHENQMNLQQMGNKLKNKSELFRRNDGFKRSQMSWEQKADRNENNANLMRTMHRNQASERNFIKQIPDSSSISSNESEMNKKIATEVMKIANSEIIHKVWPFSSNEFYEFIKDASINHLKYLTAKNCSINSLDFIATFPELMWLDVSHNHVNSFNLTSVAELKNLSVLILSKNNLTDFEYGSILEKWSNLRFIDLSYNNFTCSFVRSIRADFFRAHKKIKFEPNKCL